MQVQARAKINLCLEVLGRRPDGYHEVASVLHTLDLADELAFEPADTLSLHCEPEVGPLDDNLVTRAARLLRQRTGCHKGASIALQKAIPVAAGLGGGSSDAAATLTTLNTLWGLGLSRSELSALGAELGSDVPFFLQGGCALAQGKGEVLTALPPLGGWWAVALDPGIRVEGKTTRLYALLRERDFTDGSTTRSLAGDILKGRLETADMTEMGNVFESVAEEAFPGLSRYRRAFLKAGAPFVRLSGSGPALFTLVGSREEAEGVGGRLRKGGLSGHVAALVAGVPFA
ncbi:MAG: 4-(cytidine 5'-diphospho)-2-C-methyl-D-erythritol kinase [Chloroflexi bacterium]|nr:4-(cytidine 5'-diphospho)-2-C-methyl-D-erythritol kinase [Chloroflexota bacterium]